MKYPTTALGGILLSSVVSSVVIVLAFQPGGPGSNPVRTLYFGRAFIHLLRTLFVRFGPQCCCLSCWAHGVLFFTPFDHVIYFLCGETVFFLCPESMLPFHLGSISLTHYQTTKFWIRPN